jgi:hypothetical protein
MSVSGCCVNAGDVRTEQQFLRWYGEVFRGVGVSQSGSHSDRHAWREREREKKDYKDIEKVGEGEEDGSREIKDKRLNEKTYKCINTSTF